MKVLIDNRSEKRGGLLTGVPRGRVLEVIVEKEEEEGRSVEKGEYSRTLADERADASIIDRRIRVIAS